MRCGPDKRTKLFEAVSPTPVLRLPLKESTKCPKVAFVPQEVGLFLAFRPEFDGEGKGVHCLAVTTNVGAAEVDMLQVVLFGM